ncbi:MAG: GlcG protein [Rhodospirillales bacterium 20-60-12]|nr:MAG: GlcG protein [Rhodospirillales bacterium 20-60-12]HQT67775.1 heme-binding protein [Acetobacteraceae bacterium]
MKLIDAQTIISAALVHARANSLKPLAVVVYDARGAMSAFAAEDGCSLKRGEIAMGKAQGALALGMGSRALMKRAETQAYFIAAAQSAIGGQLVPVPGGVLVKSADGTLIGAVGISGDTSDNDEAAAIAGIAAAELTADPG